MLMIVILSVSEGPACSSRHAWGQAPRLSGRAQLA